MASTWTVRPGDNFWRVAERLLSGSYRRHPSVPEVARYWRTFIEANRRNLVHPGDPSLVFPGQVLAVPPVPERGP
jgi:nucleoid-associated protein YgaU